MNRHLMRGLLALYPPAFRDRYGAGLASLTDELVSAGEITPLLAVLNLLGGAAVEWGRVLVYSRRAAQAMTVAALMAVAGSLYVTSYARPPGTPAGVHGASVGVPRVSLPAGTCPVPAGAMVIGSGIVTQIKAPASGWQFSLPVVSVTVVVPGGAGNSPAPVSAVLASPRPRRG